MTQITLTQKLRFYLRANTGIDDQDIAEIMKCFKPRIAKKHAVLLSPGEISKELFFIESGCIRIFYLSKDGHQMTRYIGLENSIATSISSFISQNPSFEFVQALENSLLLAISHKDFYRLAAKIPLWEKFYRTFLEMAYLYQNKKIENLVMLSAKERFDQMMAESPAYAQRISNKILASYLDMSQETLSRLKSK